MVYQIFDLGRARSIALPRDAISGSLALLAGRGRPVTIAGGA
jgi:hypothetical protein